MLGKNHMVAHVCSVALISCGMTLLSHTNFGTEFSSHITNQMRILVVLPHNDIPNFVWYVGCVLLFIIGTWLPDIDNKNSILGRFIHLPIEHRTWTHTIWVLILIFGISIWYRMLFWLGFGYFLHLCWDSISYGGVCWFYPISQYMTYPNGAKIKKKHIFKIYRAGKASEYVLIGVLATITVIIVAFTLYVYFVSDVLH